MFYDLCYIQHIDLYVFIHLDLKFEIWIHWRLPFKTTPGTFLAKSINITLNFKNLKYKFIGILGTELHVLNFKLNFQPQNCIEESEVVKFGRFSFPISWVGLDGVKFLAPQYNLLCAHGY